MTTPKFLRAKDLIKIFQNNPEALIAFHDSNEDNLLIPSQIIEETIFQMGDEEFVKLSDIEELGEEGQQRFKHVHKNYLKKEHIIVLNDLIEYVFDAEGKQEIRKNIFGEKIKKYQIAIKKYMETNKILSFKDYILVFLTEFELGESEKGFTIAEIKQIVGNATDNSYREALLELEKENKIAFTGQDYSLRFTTFELHELALLKE